MKRLTIVAMLLVVGVFSVWAQELTIPQIREEWPKGALEVPQVKGKVGIVDFAYTIAKTYHGNVILDELKAQLDNPGRQNEDVDEFVLDRQNGYIILNFVSDGTVQMETCFWNRKDGRKMWFSRCSMSMRIRSHF